VLNATDVTTVINFEVMSDKFQAWLCYRKN
jgi:hypothetical protein